MLALTALLNSASAADLVRAGARVEPWNADRIVQPHGGVLVPVWWTEESKESEQMSALLLGADWTGTWGAGPASLHQLAVRAEYLQVFERSLIATELKLGSATDFQSPLLPATRVNTTAFWARTWERWDLGLGASWQTSTVARWPVPLLYVGWRPEADLSVEALLPWALTVNLRPSRPVALRLSSALDGAEWQTADGRLTVWDLSSEAALIVQLGLFELRAGGGWRALRSRELAGVELPLSSGPTAFAEIGVPMW